MQDPNDQVVVDAIQDLLTSDETIVTVARQDPKSPTVNKAAIVATSERLIIYKPRFIGSFDFQDIYWRDLQDIHIDQGMLFAGLRITRTDGTTEEVSHLTKDKARRLYGIAQEREHEWHERRRQRQMEEERARAGGIMFQGTPQSSSSEQSQSESKDDPTERLAQAKQMLDQGLIDQQEYDTIKERILSEM